MLSHIDELEKQYLEEYDLIVQKDQHESKAFNDLAYNDLKRAKYYFAFLRKQEEALRLAEQLPPEPEETAI